MRTLYPRSPEQDRPRTRPRRAPGPHPTGGLTVLATLGALAGSDGRPRELIARDGTAGSLLLIDRDATSGADERLVAHLAADEPRANAALICRLYSESPPRERRCRPVSKTDALAAPFADRHEPPGATGGLSGPEALEVAAGGFRLERLPSRMSIPELRWTRTERTSSQSRTVSLRECVAAVEDYEPFRSMTGAAIERRAGDDSVSTTTLRAELARVLDSPIVLNRGLREAVLTRVRRDGSSLSEIAIRCGRIKCDSRGNQSGETSWLARRIGVLPEGGQSEPTVWVHSDVLGLIARQGLGISPREVELG